MPGVRWKVSLLFSILVMAAFGLLASCASQGSGASSDSSGALAPGAGGLIGGGSGGGPGRFSGKAYAGGHRREAAKAAGPSIPAQPQSFAVDQAGSFYVADAMGNRVLKVDAFGITKIIAGTGARGFSGDGGPATSAALSTPTVLAIDHDGDLIMFDSGNGRFRMVTASGTITTVAAVDMGVPPHAQLPAGQRVRHADSCAQGRVRRQAPGRRRWLGRRPESPKSIVCSAQLRPRMGKPMAR